MDKIKIKDEYSVNSHILHSQPGNSSHGNSFSPSFPGQPMDVSQAENNHSESQQNVDTVQNAVDTHCLSEPISDKEMNQPEKNILLQKHKEDAVFDVVKPVPVNSKKMKCIQGVKIKQEVNETIYCEGMDEEVPQNVRDQNNPCDEYIPVQNVNDFKQDPRCVITRDLVKEKQIKIEDATIPNEDITTQTYWKVIGENSNEDKLDSQVNAMEVDQRNMPDVSGNGFTPNSEELTSCAQNYVPIKKEQVDSELIESPDNDVNHQSHIQKTYVNDLDIDKQSQGHDKSFNKSGRRFSCQECGKGFKQGSHLREHIMWKHSDERPYKCIQCGKGFIKSSKMKRHMKVHINEGAFICKECGDVFNNSGHLETHMRLHTNERPFECKECGEGFFKSSQLNIHMEIHISEKNFVCKECGKRFSDNPKLKRHMRIHRTDRPYICKECGEGFKRACHLKEHIMIHNTERLFVCTECGRGFHRSRSLKTHYKIHRNERPFVCIGCGKGFIRCGHLKTHMRTHPKCNVEESV